ncbi:polysaccharide deacetylase family protein [Brevibacterium moorei]|uniref:polysaccharide deacetylase family protein n=1 Tax=Brevibacterium moorei TaxID=2968457 RepID=UPI00211CF45B|nr:polysaccharide deacetylase family protein [Brevibacterium sp. 68QC2CO]
MPNTRARRRGYLCVVALLAVCCLVVDSFIPRVAHSRQYALFGNWLFHANTQEKVIALTLDDGPSEDPGPVLSMLNRHGVRATFFVNGMWMEKYPTVVPRLIADGHQIANHTWDHRHMIGVAPWSMHQEIAGTDRLIRQAGYTGRIAFRAPYGDKFIGLPAYMTATNRLGVMWDVSPENFRPDQTAQQMVERGMKQVHPGAIIVVHPWWDREKTRLATGIMIDLLKARGYRFVTIDQLAAMNGQG